MKQYTIPPFVTSMFLGWKVYISIETNQINEAYRVISDYNLDLDGEKTHANEAAYLAYARLLLLEHKLTEAGLLLDDLYKLAKQGNRVERLIEIKISYALFHKLKGKQETAVNDVLGAMELASDENLISYFLFNADHIYDLFEEAFKIQATQVTKIPDSFVERLKLALTTMEKRIKAQSVSELSTRELDTLKFLAQDLTNQEVADKLFISLNTVKTHLKNIYLKLEVNGRAKAIARAKELGVI